MLKMRLILTGVLGCVLVGSAHAVELRGMASVNVTSDTAMTAKNIAFDEARRQIIRDSLRQYVDVDALNTAMRGAKGAELAELVATSSIDGEKLSDTTYSANISMVLDADAVRGWLDTRGIKNWLPEDGVGDSMVVSVKMSDAMANWIQLNQILRDGKFDTMLRSMTRDTAVFELPASGRDRFVGAVRAAGWRYENSDGGIRIWK